MGRILEEKGKHWAVGQRLKAALSQEPWDKLSYGAIGKKLGDVSATTVGNWVNGKKLPKSEHLILIAKTLTISIDWLLIGQGEMVLDTSGSAIEFIVLNKALPPKAKETIHGIISLYDERLSAEEK